MEKLQRKLQNKENGNLERELSELYEILFSVSRVPYGKERKASSIRENEKHRKKIRMGEYIKVEEDKGERKRVVEKKKKKKKVKK